ncbi:MAG TPA: class I SAM-dependent methyltransferase [Gaiellaceae bacterium]|nr:class I SAM-dependent methyltransferase [Gaiellaceae bacterium]
MTRRAGHAPGWQRLWRHSYALGLSWLVRDARRGWRARRVGFVRLVVPLDPRRYYELGRIADAEFSGLCLDVSSPKLLPSLLQSERRGRWVCIDLFADEIDAWRTIDPTLELHVADATALPFEDDSFDHCVCVSVLEHIGGGRDSAALAEIWRVLKPGGTLHLTTDVAETPRDVFLERRAYGEASDLEDQRGVFFKHDYTPGEIESLLERQRWGVVTREFATLRDPRIEQWFETNAPWSYLAGPFLRFVCPGQIETSGNPDLIARADGGIAYLHLRKQVRTNA